LTRIPVIIRYPNDMMSPFVFDGLVEQVDLAPTILEALGLSVPQSMVGASLHEQILDADGTGRETILVEAGLQLPTSPGPIPEASHRAPVVPNSYGPGAMVSDGRFKLSMYTDDRHELYDLQNDPLEEHNLYGRAGHSDIQIRLMETLAQRTLGVGVRPDGDWTADCVDMRRNPPEARDTQWERKEFLKGPPSRKAKSRRNAQAKQDVVEISEPGKRKKKEAGQSKCEK
jgi:arylsulfatase A-like enzyme